MSAAAPAKTAKRVSKKTDEAPAAAAPAAAAPVAAAAPAKAPKAKAVKAEAAAPVAAAAPAVAAASAPVAAAAPAVAAEEPRLEEEVKSLTQRLMSIKETVSALVSEAKRLEKKATKVQKLADKRRRKVKVEGDENKPKKPSVFNTPTDISPALCSFLGRPAGSQESRSNVTRHINEYIKTHNLKPKGTHTINPDAKLRSLLALKDGDALTYFNLQRYLNVHYLKKTAPAATPATA